MWGLGGKVLDCSCVNALGLPGSRDDLDAATFWLLVSGVLFEGNSQAEQPVPGEFMKVQHAFSEYG